MTVWLTILIRLKVGGVGVGVAGTASGRRRL